MKLKKIFKHIPYLEALLSFLQQLGITQYIWFGITILISMFWAMWAWLVSNIPYWGIALIFASALALILIISNQAIVIFSKISAERLDHDVIGDELINLSNEMARSINDYLRVKTNANVRNREPLPISMEEHRRQWHEDREEAEKMVHHIKEKYGGRIMAALMTLNKLEIKPPFHLSPLSETTLSGMASYLGAVGQLLKTGKISVIHNMDNRANWYIATL